MSDTNTAAFCWVKAVLKNPAATAGPSLAAAQAIDHPSLRALELLQQGTVRAGLSAPPAPRGAWPPDIHLKLDMLGGKVPPPNADDIPKVPRPTAGGTPAGPAAASAQPIPGYWQQVSYAPGVDPMSGQPMVTLVFQPVPGPRDEAQRWRDANPMWFCDAFAATLLNHSF